MRPPLEWKKGDPLWKTRLTTPIESVRVASLPDSYLPWVRTFDADDKFLFECVNTGVPICTASSIHDSITSCLNQAKVPPNTPLPKGLRVPRGSQHTEQWDQEETEWPNWAPETEHARRVSDNPCKAKGRGPTAWREYCFSGGRPPEPEGSSADGTIRQIRVDTGCTVTLGFADHAGRLLKKRKSNITIHTAAKGSQMSASYSGVLSVDVMNTACDPTLPGSIPFQMDMLTCQGSGLRRRLGNAEKICRFF